MDPRRHPYSLRPLLIGLAAMLLALLALWLIGQYAKAQAHDSWISRGGLKNAAGEWCCGEGDCFVVPSKRITRDRNGAYSIWDHDVSQYGPDGVNVPLVSPSPRIIETVPESEAQPSPDGAYWRCKRPDGSRRCFFAPPPNT